MHFASFAGVAGLVTPGWTWRRAIYPAKSENYTATAVSKGGMYLKLRQEALREMPRLTGI